MPEWLTVGKFQFSANKYTRVETLLAERIDLSAAELVSVWLVIDNIASG